MKQPHLKPEYKVYKRKVHKRKTKTKRSRLPLYKFKRAEDHHIQCRHDRCAPNLPPFSPVITASQEQQIPPVISAPEKQLSPEKMAEEVVHTYHAGIGYDDPQPSWTCIKAGAIASSQSSSCIRASGSVACRGASDTVVSSSSWIRASGAVASSCLYCKARVGLEVSGVGSKWKLFVIIEVGSKWKLFVIIDREVIHQNTQSNIPQYTAKGFYLIYSQ